MESVCCLPTGKKNYGLRVRVAHARWVDLWKPGKRAVHSAQLSLLVPLRRSPLLILEVGWQPASQLYCLWPDSAGFAGLIFLNVSAGVQTQSSQEVTFPTELTHQPGPGLAVT